MIHAESERMEDWDTSTRVFIVILLLLHHNVKMTLYSMSQDKDTQCMWCGGCGDSSFAVVFTVVLIS